MWTEWDEDCYELMRLREIVRKRLFGVENGSRRRQACCDSQQGAKKMKFNLKNRPNTIEEEKNKGFNLYKTNRERVYEWEQWADRFEKELREKLPKDENVIIHSMHDNVKVKIALCERRNTIKEILGK